MSSTPYPDIQSFISYLKYQKRYSRNTLVSYENDLLDFSNFCNNQFEETSVSAIKPVFIRSWLAEMKNNGIEARSLNRKISSLKSFFKYLLREGKIESTPMTAIISPKIKKRLPQFVDSKDMSRLFEGIEFPEGFEGQTQKLILSVFYHTGIRRAELIGLKETQLDFSNQTIKVFGKGSKERIIPVTHELLEGIKSYLEEKHRLFGKGEEMVFVTSKGKPLYPKYVYNLVKAYLSQVTTIDKKSPHVLRHSFATHLMNNGAELNAVKELLGHSSLAATQVYTHNSIEKLKDVFKKAHPHA